MEKIFANLKEKSPWLLNYYKKYNKNSWILNPNHKISKDYLIKHLKKNWPQLLVLKNPNIKNELRQFKNSSLMSIIARDINNLSDLDENLQSITSLAEICIQIAYKYSFDKELEVFCKKNKNTQKPNDLLIVAMGKLGGKELNPSSDIDLIFLNNEFEDKGEKLVNQNFYRNTIHEFIDTLSANSQEGMVFRVDIRLRPFGVSGPLCTSISSLKSYFSNNAMDWERFAWTKGRIVNYAVFSSENDFNKNKRLFESIKNSFVYRPYLDFNVVESLRNLSIKIKDHHHKKTIKNRANTKYEFNLKLSPGGIRDIELISQLQQLIRGGNYKSLQTYSTQNAIKAIHSLGFLSNDEFSKLTNAYIFFRKLEHRIQYFENQQVHLYKEDLMLKIPPIIDTKSNIEIIECIEIHRKNVIEIFNKSFNQKFNTIKSSAKENLNLENKIKTIVEKKFKNEKIQNYFTSLISSIKGRNSYLVMLEEYPNLITKISKIILLSPWAGNYIKKYPKILDQLLKEQSILKKLNFESLQLNLSRELKEIFSNSPDNAETQLNHIRDFHHNYLFQLLVQDLENLWSVEELSDQLSDLADIVIEETLFLALKSIKAEHLKEKLAVIAYGKLGGRELGFASDLDLIFLTDKLNHEHQPTLVKVIKRFVSWISARTPAGSLFKVDTRLRPNGSSGLLVTSINSFFEYQMSKAWIWEHQALTRARFCGGNKLIGQQFEKIRDCVISKKRNHANLMEEILAMRKKVFIENKESNINFDIKTTKGGMIDIEFLVQAIILNHSCTVVELRKNIGNIGLLKLSGEKGLIPSNLANKVSRVYSKYRTIQHKQRLSVDSFTIDKNDLVEDRKIVNKLWDLVFFNGPKKIRTLSQIHSKIQ